MRGTWGLGMVSVPMIPWWCFLQFLGGLVVTIFLDIIYISIFYPTSVINDTGRFSAGMAILSLLLKPFSCCLVYHMHRERGGELPLRPGKSYSVLPLPDPSGKQSLLQNPEPQLSVWCDSFCCQTSLSPERVRSQEGVQLPRAAGSLWFGPAGGCRNNSFLVFPPSPGSEAVLSCPVGCAHHGQTVLGRQ